MADDELRNLGNAGPLVSGGGEVQGPIYEPPPKPTQDTGWSFWRGLEAATTPDGQLPMSVRIKQQHLDNALKIKDLEFKTAEEKRTAAAFSEEQALWPLKRNQKFLADLPLYRDTISRIQDPTERTAIAEQLAATLPDGAQRRIIHSMAANPFNAAGASIVLQKMIKDKLIEPPATPEQAEHLIDSDYVKQWSKSAGAQLFTSVVGMATSNVDDKPVNFRGMDEADARKHLAVGMNKLMVPTPVGGQPADQQDAQFFNFYLDTPDGQRDMAALGIHTKEMAHKEALMPPSMDKEKVGFVRQEVARIEQEAEAELNKEKPDWDKVKSLHAERRKLFFPSGSGSKGSKSASDFVGQATEGVFDNFPDWAQADPKAAQAGYKQFRIENPIEVLARGRQVTSDIKQIETAEDHLITLDKVKNNISTDFSLIDKLITKTQSGLARGAFLKGGAMTGKIPEASAYDAFRNAFASNMARELGGEKGVLTDVDITRWAAILPNFHDSYETKELKKQIFFDFFNFAYQQQKRVAAGSLSASAVRDSKSFNETKDRILGRADKTVAGDEVPPPVTGSKLEQQVDETLYNKALENRKQRLGVK